MNTLCGADDGTRTHMIYGRQILSLLRLPFRHIRKRPQNYSKVRLLCQFFKLINYVIIFTVLNIRENIKKSS